MLHIILLILKIIGIILLVLLALVILAILAILFVPVRYRVKVAYDGKLTANVRVTWLLHLLRCHVSYDDKLLVRVKIAMFTVYGEKKRRRKVDKELKKDSRNFNRKVKDVFEEKEEEVAQSQTTDYEIVDKDYYDESEDMEKDASPVGKSSAESKIESETESKTESETESTSNLVNESIEKKPDHDSSDHNEYALTDEIKDSEGNEEKGHERSHKKPGFFRWIRYCIRKAYQKIRALIVRIKQFFVHVRDKIKELYQNMTTSKDSIVLKIKTIYEMIHSEENQELVSFLWKQSKLVIRKIRPRKYRIHLHYGFEDPYTTGQVSMALAALSGMMGLAVHANPEFESEVLEGDIYLKGHVRVFPLLVIALRVYTNKLFRKIILKSGK